MVSTSDYGEQTVDAIYRQEALQASRMYAEDREETQIVVDPPTRSIESQIYETIVSGYNS